MPHQRKCNKRTDSQTRASSQIVIPIREDEYAKIIDNPTAYRAYLDQMIDNHPELFPPTIGHGYRWYGMHPASKKMPTLRRRRLRLKADGHVLTIAPSFVMPYATGTVVEVEKALFLRRFGVPYWGLT
jgi:hypothetical protein